MIDSVFDGLKVIDCASYIAAPAAATILGDFGADVIKIEPLSGDPYRGQRLTGPDAVSSIDSNWALDSRNKRSLALNLASVEGQSILHRLVSDADVFIANYPEKVRKKLHLDYDELAKLNPRLIYALFSSFGEVGPEANKPGFDATVWWARTGLMHMMRRRDTAPIRPGPGMGDHSAAVSLYAAIATALYKREKTGKGDFIGTSLLMDGLWANASSVQMSICGVDVQTQPERTDFPTPLRNTYLCEDGKWIILTVPNTDERFAVLQRVLNAPSLEDSRFKTLAGREQHRRDLTIILDKIFVNRTAAEWSRDLEVNGIAIGVQTPVSETWKDPQALASGAIVPTKGEPSLTVSSPFWIQSENKRTPEEAPSIGQHTDEILRRAGYSNDQLKELREKRVIG